MSEVNYRNQKLKLTGFHGPFPADGSKPKVVTKKIDYADLKGSLYKVIYEDGRALEKGNHFDFGFV